MTIFFYPPEDDQPAQVEKPTRFARRESVLSTYEAKRASQAAESWNAAARTRVATFRIPVDLLKRLDRISEDAATSRGHLLRQLIAEYVGYVEEHNVRYNGSLLSSHAPSPGGRVRASDAQIVL